MTYSTSYSIRRSRPSSFIQLHLEDPQDYKPSLKLTGTTSPLLTKPKPSLEWIHAKKTSLDRYPDTSHIFVTTIGFAKFIFLSHAADSLTWPSDTSTSSFKPFSSKISLMLSEFWTSTHTLTSTTLPFSQKTRPSFSLPLTTSFFVNTRHRLLIPFLPYFIYPFPIPLNSKQSRRKYLIRLNLASPKDDLMTTRPSKSGKSSICIIHLETSNYFLQINFFPFSFSNFPLYVSFLSIFNSLLVQMISPNTYPHLISPFFSYLHPVQTFTPNSLLFFLFSYSLNPHSNHYSLSYSLATPIHDPIHIVPNSLCNPLVLSHVIDSLPNCTTIVVSESLVSLTTCLNKNYLNFSLIMFPAPDNYLVHDKFIMPSSHDLRFISFFNLRQKTLVYLTEVPSYRKCPIHRPLQFDSEYARPRDRPTWSGPSCSKHVKSLKPTMDKLPVLTEFLDSGKSHSDSNQTYSCFFMTTMPENLIDPYYDFESNLGDIEFTSDETFSEDDEYMFYPNENHAASAFTMYKCVDRKIHPVSTTFPTECQVTHQISEDPLITLPVRPF